MLAESLRLATVLDDLAAGRTNAPGAEQRLRTGGRPHHVFDPDGLLGLDPLAQVPVRQALARLEHSPFPVRPVWALLLPRPGHLAGLRGPVAVNQLAMASGAMVVTHDGALGLVGEQVGAGVQWRLVRAERPVPPPDPREAARQLSSVMAAATNDLAALGIVAGRRPSGAGAPLLGAGFDERSQQLLDRAWLLLAVVAEAMAAQAEVLHSHAVLAREQHLRDLENAALDAISAAASWPAAALG